MFVVKNRKIFYILSGTLIAISLAALLVWGLNLGIDFKGGTIMEFRYQAERPDISVLNNALQPLNIKGLSLRPLGTDGFVLRSEPLDEATHQAVLKVAVTEGAKINEPRFLGPLLGKEAAFKSLWAIIFVLAAIILFITYAFRKVSAPVSSWKYGVIAVSALLHDVFIPIGLFSILGHIKGFEIDTLFVTAILVVLGFSVHDTIVVFDRVRENLKLEYGHPSSRAKLATGQARGGDFETIVGKSIEQTYVRSINTSLTTLLALVVLYFLGPASTKLFSLVLIVGVTVGTYSSIFIASTLLVTVEKWQQKKRN
jgi:preprotein translocase subunit SecF